VSGANEVADGANVRDWNIILLGTTLPLLNLSAQVLAFITIQSF
jgi:hypothetical protein